MIAAAAADAKRCLVDDVTEISVENGTLKSVHPVYAGKVLSDVSTEQRLTLVTVRSRAFAAPTPDTSKSGDVILLRPYDRRSNWRPRSRALKKPDAAQLSF